MFIHYLLCCNSF